MKEKQKLSRDISEASHDEYSEAQGTTEEHRALKNDKVYNDFLFLKAACRKEVAFSGYFTYPLLKNFENLMYPGKRENFSDDIVQKIESAIGKLKKDYKHYYGEPHELPPRMVVGFYPINWAKSGFYENSLYATESFTEEDTKIPTFKTKTIELYGDKKRK